MMKRATKLIVALITSGALALGAAAPAIAQGPPGNPGEGTDTACSVVDSDAGGGAAHRALGCP